MKGLKMLKFALVFCVLAGLSGATYAQVLKCTGENEKGATILLSVQMHPKNKVLTVGAVGEFKAVTWSDVLVLAERRVKIASITTQYIFTLDRVTGQFSYQKDVDVLSAKEVDLQKMQTEGSFLGFAFVGSCAKATPLF